MPVLPGVVVEVSYDQLTGGRFRHATRFERWRPDKDAEECTVDQLALPEGPGFGEVVGPMTGNPHTGGGSSQLRRFTMRSRFIPVLVALAMTAAACGDATQAAGHRPDDACRAPGIE